MATLTACRTSEKVFLEKKSQEFTSQPLKDETILTAQDIKHLPACVQKYLAYTGAVG